MTEKASNWQPPDTLPTKNGTEAILWLTTDKGFPDVSAHCFLKNGSWYWMDTHEVVKRQDFIMGWQPWPEPPITYSLKQKKTKPLKGLAKERVIFHKLHYHPIAFLVSSVK